MSSIWLNLRKIASAKQWLNTHTKWTCKINTFIKWTLLKMLVFFPFPCTMDCMLMNDLERNASDLFKILPLSAPMRIASRLQYKSQDWFVVEIDIFAINYFKQVSCQKYWVTINITLLLCTWHIIFERLDVESCCVSPKSCLETTQHFFLITILTNGGDVIFTHNGR